MNLSALLGIFIATSLQVPSVLREPLPNQEAFRGWKKVMEENLPADPEPVRCGNKSLRPTHGAMSLKKYHRHWKGTYNHFFLKAQDAACKIGGKFPNAKGILPCFMPRELEYFVLSDTFEDSCGNFYRGYFEVLFFRDLETDATLYSPGRSVVKRLGPSNIPEFVPGPIGEVKEDSFMLLQIASPADREKILQEKN